MELVELEVRDRGARAIRHRDPVARRDVGIGGVQIDFARATRREHRGARNDFADFVRVAIECVNAPACAGLASRGSLDEKINRDVILQRADIRARLRGLGERAHYLASGQILRMQHAAVAVPAFLAEIVFELAVIGAVGLAIFDLREAGAETDQFAHRLWTFADDGLDRVAIA